MKCPYCGKISEGRTIYCPYCGGPPLTFRRRKALWEVFWIALATIIVFWLTRSGSRRGHP